ncbi:MAG: hypothetical protein E7425_05190 [Ruminococcaceae bacterium]|jgi:uncharacterized repeat protein (TIGR02543 family)|nr:hypothetical protein [Oscillospiraceae bacterium]
MGGKESMKRMKQLWSMLLALTLALSLAAPATAAEDATATTIRLSEIEGTVIVKDQSGKEKTARADMRIYSGYSIETGKSSSAYITLDDSKAIMLDALGKVEIKKSGKKLELALTAGKLAYNVSKPLDKDESLEIVTATMVTGVRGSSGWNTLNSSAKVEGDVTAATVSGETIPLKDGEILSVPEGGGKPERRTMTEKDIPSVMTLLVIKTPELYDKVTTKVTVVNYNKVIEYLPQKLEEESNEEQRTEKAAEEAQIEQANKIAEADAADAAAGYVQEIYFEKPSAGTDTPQPTTSAADAARERREERERERWEEQNKTSEEIAPALCYVTFIANADDATGKMSVQTVQLGARTMLSPNAFTRQGYAFDGWNTEADRSGTAYADGAQIVPTGNLTLYAQWRKISPTRFTITFVGNGGMGSMSQQVIPAGSGDELFENKFSYTGYTFVGWNTRSDGKGVSYPDREWVKPTADMTLYAQWEMQILPQDVTVTFDANDGTGATATQSIEPGKATSLDSNPFTRKDYTFTGWTTNADGSGDKYAEGAKVTLTADLTLYAQWTQTVAPTRNVTVTFHANDGTNATTTQDIQENVETALDSNTFTRKDHTFDGWTTNADGSGDKYADGAKVTLTADLDLYAQWAQVTAPTQNYTVTFYANGGTGTMGTQSIAPNSQTSLHANQFTRDQYTFTGWNTQADGQGTAYGPGATVTLTADLELYAQWAKTVTLSILKSDVYTVDVDDTKYDVKEDTQNNAVVVTLAEGDSATFGITPVDTTGTTPLALPDDAVFIASGSLTPTKTEKQSGNTHYTDWFTLPVSSDTTIETTLSSKDVFYSVAANEREFENLACFVSQSPASANVAVISDLAVSAGTNGITITADDLLVKNGAKLSLTGYVTVGTGAKLTNNGTVAVGSGGVLDVRDDSKGTAGVGGAGAYTLSTDAKLIAQSSSYSALQSSVSGGTLYLGFNDWSAISASVSNYALISNLSMDSNLDLSDGNLLILDGVTLKIGSSGSVDVPSSGTLTILNGGKVTVEGLLKAIGRVENAGTLQLSRGSTLYASQSAYSNSNMNVTNTDPQAPGTVYYIAATETELGTMLTAKENYIVVCDSLTLSSNVEIPSKTELLIVNGATLEIASGATVEVQSGATLSVGNGGTLVNKGALTVGGTLANNGTVNHYGEIDSTFKDVIDRGGNLLSISLSDSNAELSISGSVTGSGTVNYFEGV